MTSIASCPAWQQIEWLDTVARQLLEHGWVVRMPRPVPGEPGHLAVSEGPFTPVVTVAVDAEHRLIMRTPEDRPAQVVDVALLHPVLRAVLSGSAAPQALARSA